MFFTSKKKPAQPDWRKAIDRAISDAKEAGVDARLIANYLETQSEQVRIGWALSAPLGHSLT
jgi:ABC-type amino acid transport substrate-binding protein